MDELHTDESGSYLRRIKYTFYTTDNFFEKFRSLGIAKQRPPDRSYLNQTGQGLKNIWTGFISKKGNAI